MSSRDERDAREEFSARYSLGRGHIVEAIEREVIGADWGANGFTTVEQADDLARRLSLSPEARLLDIGAGRGWPSLYLGRETGCEVVVTDLPLEGLSFARERARREDVRLLGAVAGSARDLPFKPESFDAIVHTDVLC